MMITVVVGWWFDGEGGDGGGSCARTRGIKISDFRSEADNRLFTFITMGAIVSIAMVFTPGAAHSTSRSNRGPSE